MINPNILNILKSTLNDPSYCTLIQSFNQKEYCDKEQLDIIIRQYSPNLLKIIEGQNIVITNLISLLQDNDIEFSEDDYYTTDINNIIEKTLTIQSALKYGTENAMFTSALTGTISKEEVYEESEEISQDDISSSKIECARFDLQHQIDIDFINTFAHIPSVNITVDSSQKMFASYETKFKTNSDGDYSGVTITFNKLKRIRNPIEVSALIIGD